MNTGFSQRRRGLIAATSALFVAAGIAVASVAGAAQDAVVYVSENGGFCFTTSPSKPACTTSDVNLTIQTGDKVTWDYSGSTIIHNAYPGPGTASTPANTAWDARRPAFQQTGTDEWTFGAAGVYRFYCQVHASMFGTITVEGGQVETPTPTATASATATATATAQATTSPTPTASPRATPDDHTTTPAPGHASSAKDGAAPRLQSTSVKRVAAGAQVRFWLSEPATVTIAVVRKGAKASAASAVVQAPAGTRSFVLRTKALKRGAYTVRFAPVDAMGNKGAAAAKSLRVR
jgi:plastocyanin